MDLLAVNLAETWTTLIWPIIMFIIGLGVVVLVHELGHFMVAKWVGIRVEVFSIGMGPRLFGYRGKETDYRISLVPIGGYIKMTGQEDVAPLKEGDVDSRSFANKSVGARFAVIAAGVIMNVLFAAVAYVVVGLVGIRYFAPVVGEAVPYYPAARANITWDDDGAETVGLKPGDTILSIDGRTTEGFQHIRTASVLADRDDVFEFVFSRPGVDGQERIGRTNIGVTFSDQGGSVTLAFGLAPPFDLAFGQAKDLILPDDGFAAGDRVIAIDGREIEHFWQLPQFAEYRTDVPALTGEPVTVTLRRADSPETYTVRVKPKLRMAPDVFFLTEDRVVRPADARWDYNDRKDPKIIFTLADDTTLTVSTGDEIPVVLDVIGLQPRMTVEAVAKGSPADDADLRPGDIVIGHAGRGPPTLAQFLEINEEFVDEGTQIIVQRDGKALPPIDIRPKKKKGQVLVGARTGIDEQHLVVARVRAGSPAADADVRSGDVITHVDGSPVGAWLELIDALAGAQQAGDAVTLSFRRGAHDLAADLGELTDEQFDRGDYDLVLFAGPRPFKTLRSRLIKHGNPLSAMAWGIGQTLDKLRIGYMQFPSLFKGNVSVKEVQGPIGIATIAVRTARLGLMEFVDFMALISVILAVVNFLPIPVVDGGHAVFLIIEKVRGRPLSVRVMNVVQIVGLVLLLGVFIIITWRDIARLISNMW